MAVAVASTVMAQIFTDPVGFVKVDAIAGGLTMVSVPLGAQDMAINGAAGCVGDIIKEQLIAAEYAGAADSLYIWDPVGRVYSQLWLVSAPGDPVYDRKWLTPTNEISTLVVKVGDAFWVDRRYSGGTTKATITFLGWVPTEATKTVTLYPGLTMTAWPYPTELLLNDSTLGTVGKGADNAGEADTVYEWDVVGNVYVLGWLVYAPGDPMNGKWVVADASALSSIKFKPGAAVWYFRQPTQPALSWVCSRPYTL